MTNEDDRMVLIPRIDLGIGERERGEREGRLKADGFERQEIAANRGPVYRFWGKLIAEESTQNAKRTRTQWTETRLWETPGGTWIVENVGCSDADGQVDIVDVGTFPLHQDYHVRKLTRFHGIDAGAGDRVSRECAVMLWLEGGHPARAIAKRLGWDLSVDVA